MWTCKISARFHSLTETSPDRNGPDRNGPDRNGSDRIGQTEKPRTHVNAPFALHRQQPEMDKQNVDFAEYFLRTRMSVLIVFIMYSNTCFVLRYK